MRRMVMVSLLLVIARVDCVTADDWPQWLGPNRDSVLREDGIVDRFPEAGLAVKWRVPVGWGYAGPAVANGRVYLADYVHQSGEVTNRAGSRDNLVGSERLLCLDARDGTILWKHEYERRYEISYPRGPRCTPTVSGGKVYSLGAEGNLICLNANSGDVIWSRDLVAEYEATTPQWGYTNHPLVHGELVFCLAGGEGRTVVAFHKDTGEEAWRALSASEPGYCAPTLVEVGDEEHLVIWHRDAIQSLNPLDGQVRWSAELSPRFGLATAAPRLVGENLFVTGAGVSALIHAKTGEFIWKGSGSTSMACSMSTPIIDGDVIYGCDGAGKVIAARVEDGHRLWETSEPVSERPQRNGTAFLVKNGDRFFLFNDSGELVLAALTKDGYQEISRFHVLEATNYTGSRNVVWSHPAFAEKCLFARNDKELVCVDLAASP